MRGQARKFLRFGPPQARRGHLSAGAAAPGGSGDWAPAATWASRAQRQEPPEQSPQHLGASKSPRAALDGARHAPYVMGQSVPAAPADAGGGTGGVRRPSGDAGALSRLNPAPPRDPEPDQDPFAARYGVFLSLSIVHSFGESRAGHLLPTT